MPCPEMEELRRKAAEASQVIEEFVKNCPHEKIYCKIHTTVMTTTGSNECVRCGYSLGVWARTRYSTDEDSCEILDGPGAKSLPS
jgi:hypothetical protein